MKKLLSIFILLGVITSGLNAQTRTITGRIITDLFDTAAYVVITMNDTLEVGIADINGFFHINIPVSVREIQLRLVGLDPTDIELTDSCNELEVIMMASATYDFIPLKKVDQLRMKRFKQLPELHRRAVAKGIFSSDNICYRQKFLPGYVKGKKLM